jgi:hypothetical protein
MSPKSTLQQTSTTFSNVQKNSSTCSIIPFTISTYLQYTSVNINEVQQASTPTPALKIPVSSVRFYIGSYRSPKGEERSRKIGGMKKPSDLGPEAFLLSVIEE